MTTREELEKLPPLERRAKALSILAVGQYVKRIVQNSINPAMDAAKTFLAESMSPGDRAHANIDGIDVGTISRAQAPTHWEIVDEQAYGNWLETSGNVSNPWEVRPAEKYLASSYLNLLKKQAEETGEVPDGVEVTEGAPSFRTNISAQQQFALDAMRELAGLREAIDLIAATDSEVSEDE